LCETALESSWLNISSVLRFCSACTFKMNHKLLLYEIYKMEKKKKKIKKKHPGLSPRANYTDRATAACRPGDCQLLRIEGATWSAWRIPTAVFSVF
jgi:hypothetical protein